MPRRWTTILLFAAFLLALLANVAAAQENPPNAATPVGGATLDTDEDGLTDDEEIGTGTDPARFDTDGDGLGDGAEARADGWGTDPLLADTDGDALPDGDELFTHGTDPKLADSDDDGSADGAEIGAATDPNDPASRPAGGDDLGSVRVVAYACPVAYEGKDPFVDCAPLPDVGIAIGLVASEFFASAVTDAAGEASFAQLGEGAHALALDVPGGFARFSANCGVERGFELSPIGASNGNRIEIPLGPGDHVRCAWFVTPVDARGEPTPAPGGDAGSILIEKSLCPVAYAGSNFAADCNPLPGIAFSLGVPGSEFFASATTDADGTAAFTELDGGIYVLAEGIPGDFNRIEVFCAAPNETEPRPIRSNGINQIEVELLPGERITCTWYNIPADARGEPAPTAAPEPTEAAKPTPGIAPPTPRPAPVSGGTTPVTALPNTGTASAASTASAALSGTAALIFGLGLVAGAVGASRRR